MTLLFQNIKNKINNLINNKIHHTDRAMLYLSDNVGSLRIINLQIIILILKNNIIIFLF